MIAFASPPNRSAFWCTHEFAAATSLAPAGQGLAGARRYAIVTPTIPWRAARQMAWARNAQSDEVPSFVKLSPATNSSTGRGVEPLSVRVATSSRFCSFSPYFRPRVSDTPVQGSSVGSAEGLASSTRPACNRRGTACGHCGEVPCAESIAIAAARLRTRNLIMSNRARVEAVRVDPGLGDLTTFSQNTGPHVGADCPDVTWLLQPYACRRYSRR